MTNESCSQGFVVVSLLDSFTALTSFFFWFVFTTAQYRRREGKMDEVIMERQARGRKRKERNKKKVREGKGQDRVDFLDLPLASTSALKCTCNITVCIKRVK